MISVSTGWRAGRVRNGRRLLEATLAAGAEAVELEYRTSERMLRQMRPILATGEPVVTSVHNFFPIPQVVPPRLPGGDVFNFASDSEEERRLAVKFGIRSLQTGAGLGAKAIVFHLNKVPMPDGMRELKSFFDQGSIESETAASFRRELLEGRGKLARRAFAQALRSVEQLTEAARELNVSVGIENRYHPTEIPDFDEFAQIFERFPDGPVAYWHDVGHAFVQERLGFTTQRELLEAFGPRMAGVHIHDVLGYDDHWAPGTGEVDFEKIVGHVPPAALRIIEVHSKVSAAELSRSLRFVSEVGF